MRFSISTLIVLAIITSAFAQPADDFKAKARAALSLAKIKRDADGAEAKAKVMLSLAQCQRERGACLDDVGAAMDRAAKDGKRVFIWVGMTCHDEPALRAEFPGVVHCHTDTLNNNATPRLLVGPLPDGTFQPVPRSKIDAKTPAAIRGLLNKQASPPVPVSFAPSPVMRAANC